MKICLIGNATAVHLQRWASAYVDAGHDVHVVSIRSHTIEGAAVHSRHIGRRNSTAGLWTTLSYLWLGIVARRLVKQIDPDVVHAQFVTTSGVIARLSGSDRVVLTAWGSDVIPPDGRSHNMIIRMLNRWAFAGAQCVTSASVFMLEHIETAYGVSNVNLVPFGVDTNLFTPSADRRSGPLRLGIVKNLKPKYGVDHAIAALSIIRNTLPGTSLTVAGTGRLLPELERQVRSAGLEDDVYFLGSVPHADVPDVLRSVDIFLNTSVVPESFGVAVLEAEACGVPVVATAVGGVPETCLPGESALLVPPRDPQAIAAAVVALSDQDTRRAFGVAGRHFVEDRFTWDRSVSSMLRILERVSRP